ncbi:MAG TPA: phage tail protein [Ilumatobacter sp.]|jgi:phage tail-like protein|nr:phage tail protein [Ilumatobacter sp.]
MPVTTPGQVQDIELVGSWFHIKLDNGIEGFFTDASGFGYEVEVVEKTEANTDTRTRKRPGTTKYQDITLKRALSPDKKFWNWIKSIRDGKLDYRTNGSLVISDMSGKELSRWTFNNVWPSKWSASDLDVGSDDLMTEEITLAVEELIRDK